MGADLFVNDNKVHLMVNRHPKTNLGEWRSPVGRELRLMSIEPSLPSRNVEGFLVGPKAVIAMEGSLKLKVEQIPFYQPKPKQANETEQKGQKRKESD